MYRQELDVRVFWDFNFLLIVLEASQFYFLITFSLQQQGANL